MLEVLRSRAEIREARRDLERRGLSCTDLALRPPGGLLRRLRTMHRRRRNYGERIGDARKSWDVRRTLDFVSAHFPREARILDLGAYRSEVLPALLRLGYRDLTGVDLDPAVVRMPHADAIAWREHDFHATAFAAGSFEVVTAISVIEHGFDPDRLLPEVFRLLAPGGCFVASVDYWPEKVPTDGVRLFDMTWRVFSRDELLDLLERAERVGLRPEGRLRFDAEETTIRFMERAYTFAWLVLRKPGDDACG